MRDGKRKSKSVMSNDSLAWNFVRAVKDRSDTTHQLEGLFDLDNVDPQGNDRGYPIFWACIYVIVFILVVRKSLKTFFNFQTYQQNMVMMIRQAPKDVNVWLNSVYLLFVVLLTLNPLYFQFSNQHFNQLFLSKNNEILRIILI